MTERDWLTEAWLATQRANSAERERDEAVDLLIRLEPEMHRISPSLAEDIRAWLSSFLTLRQDQPLT